jgi:hypothetical protein
MDDNMNPGIATLRADYARRAVNLTTGDGTQAAPGWAKTGLRATVGHLSEALRTVDSANEQLARTLGDQNISDALRATRVEALLTQAQALARAELAAANQTASQLHTALREKVLPPRPKNASDTLVVDRKADLAALLDGEPDGEAVGLKAYDLAKRALTKKDDLSYHVLAGGPLRLYLERRGVDVGALATRFATLDNSQPETRLLEGYSGPNGIKGFLTVGENLLDMALTDATERYQPELDRLKATLK